MAFSWTGEQDPYAEATEWGAARWDIYVKQIGTPGNPIKLTTSLGRGYSGPSTKHGPRTTAGSPIGAEGLMEWIS